MLLYDLPPELLLHITTFLSVPDLARLQRASAFLRTFLAVVYPRRLIHDPTTLPFALRHYITHSLAAPLSTLLAARPPADNALPNTVLPAPLHSHLYLPLVLAGAVSTPAITTLLLPHVAWSSQAVIAAIEARNIPTLRILLQHARTTEEWPRKVQGYLDCAMCVSSEGKARGEEVLALVLEQGLEKGVLRAGLDYARRYGGPREIEMVARWLEGSEEEEDDEEKCRNEMRSKSLQWERMMRRRMEEMVVRRRGPVEIQAK